MSQENSLKQKNLGYVSAYLILNAVAFLLVNNLPTAPGSWGNLLDLEKCVKTGTGALGLQLFALLLSYVVPVGIKNVLVFWRVRHALPGCRAFSVYACRDPRVDLQAIERTLSLPTDPDDQNRIWYGLFKKVENETVVLQAHGRYLLFRDLTAIAALLVPLLAVPTFVLSTGIVPWVYAGLLVGGFLALSLAGRNAGQRFVCDVLARTSWD
ncbi:MAG: hypothetical protein KKI08_08080 [Armatimonadetes bacterium]|nr:hypothetical protein [Armatimonadota bacterium]